MPHKQNYAAKAEQKKLKRLENGLISELFPKVSDMVIHMTYYQKGINPILMQRTVNVVPNDTAYFIMRCMIKGCDDGGFDLTPVIARMIKAHKKTEKGTLVCRGKSKILGPGHASIAYEIGIHYNRHS